MGDDESKEKREEERERLLRRRRHRRVGVVLVVLAALGLLALGGALGWYLHEWSGRGDLKVAVDRPVQVYAPEAVKEGTVPNVVGLAEDEALRVLSDAGVTLARVRTHVVSAVGPSGLVVRQSPPSGVPLAHRAIALELSGPAVMPELEGKEEAEAKEALSQLGARVSVISRYEAGADEGTVLATDPLAGETIADKAVLEVAAPLSSVFVTQLIPLQASCRTGEEALLAGEEQAEAVICLPEPGANPRSVTYQLGGEAETFEADLGLDDGGNAEAPVEFRVLVDGRPALTRQLRFGESLPVEVPVLGSFQLQLEATAVGRTAPGSPPLRAVFGEPRLVGSREAIDRISEGLGE
ncbi:MAG: PASTA domain-containing protein [Solirubrobacterales bacterium]